MQHRLLFLLIVTSSCCVAQLPVSGLIAYYPFNNSTNDESGFNNNGKIVGNVQRAADRFGNPCGALRFDGVSGYVSVPTSASIQSPRNAISIAAWVKLELPATGQADKWVTLLCKGHNPVETPANPAYRFQVFQGNTQSTVSMSTEFTEYDTQFKQHPFAFNQWYFYALVYDGMQVQMYVNGALLFQFPYTGVLNTNAEPLDIGRDIPGSTEFFSGCMDDLRIYNRPLTGSEIQLLVNDRAGKLFSDGITLTMPGNIERETDKSNCSASVIFPNPTATALCGNVQIVQVSGKVSGSRFEPGVWPVRFVAEGEVGTKQSCSFDVIVRDRTDPELSCPGDIKIKCSTGTDKVKVDYAPPTAKDNCPNVKAELISGIASGSFFTVGIHTVSYKATDAAGNETTCQFKITVVPADSVAKVVALPPVKDSSAKTVITNIPVVVQEDSVHYAGEVTKVENCDLTLLVFDSGLEDNDTVSIIFNGKILADRVMLRSRKANTLDNIIKSSVSLEAGKPNYLVVKAWNTGKTWPNTVTIDVYFGIISNENEMGSRKALRKVIEAVPGVAGGVVFTCEK